MSAYPWHVIGGVTADGLSFRTWRRSLVYAAENTQAATDTSTTVSTRKP